jgi:hypothetical protein
MDRISSAASGRNLVGTENLTTRMLGSARFTTKIAGLIDHVFSPIRDNDLDGTLARFERAGFLINPERVRHRPGRLNGFATLTESYLEFMSVVDEAKFARDATPEERFYRRHPHPSGIGFRTADARALHRKLSRVCSFPPQFLTQAPAGDPARRPAWRICVFPRLEIAGAFAFGIEYLGRRRRRSLRQGPNTIFALGGVTYCTRDPRMTLTLAQRLFAES